MGSRTPQLPARLVVGTDLSAGSSSALRLAQTWSVLNDVPFEMLHATDGTLPTEDEAVLSSALADHAVAATGATSPPPLRILGAEPSEALITSAAEEPGTWIVAGAEGSGARALRRAGRTVLDLCLRSPVAVFVAPPRWRPPARRSAASKIGFSRILVGLAGERRDFSLLQLGQALSTSVDGLLMACHSVDLSATSLYPAKVQEGLTAKRAPTVTRVTDGFHDSIDALNLPVATPFHVIEQGPIHHDLAGLAEAQEASLIVVGAGSTAGLLAGVSQVPLLVLPKELKLL